MKSHKRIIWLSGYRCTNATPQVSFMLMFSWCSYKTSGLKPCLASTTFSILRQLVYKRVQIFVFGFWLGYLTTANHLRIIPRVPTHESIPLSSPNGKRPGQCDINNSLTLNYPDSLILNHILIHSVTKVSQQVSI